MAKFNVDLVANIKDFLASMSQAQAATIEATEKMKGAVESVSATWEKVQGAMVAFTAVLAGGAAFKEAITATVSLSSNAAALGKQLGITATEASILRVAMDEALVPQEAMTTAAGKVAQTLKKNENAFRELGVATRDQNGNFRDSLEIIQDVNTKLLTFKEGTDRNVEGAKIYGRSWGEVAPTLKLTAERMEEARMKAAQLGLIVGAEGVKKARDYKEAMAGVHTVFDALQNVIGQAVLPVLTKVAQWFNSVGPQAVAIFRTAIYTVYAAFSYSKEQITIEADAIAGALVWLVGQFNRFASTADRALHFDFSGAKAAWAAGTADIAARSKAVSEGIISDMKAAAKARDDFFNSQDAQQTPTTAKGGAASTGGDGKEKSQMAEFEEMLAARKSAWTNEQNLEGGFREFSKQQELEYWTAILETVRKGSADYVSIQRKIYDEKYAIRKQDYEAELASLKADEAAHKNNLAARLEDEMKFAALVKKAYGDESPEYAAAQKSIVETKRAAIAQQQAVDDIYLDQVRTRALEEVQAKQDAAKLAYEDGRLSLERYVELEREFENQSLAIRQDGLRTKIKLAAMDPETSPEKVAQLNVQLEQLESTHQKALAKIDQQASAEKVKLYHSLASTLGNSFSNAFQGIINGTMTMGQAVKSVFSSMLQTIIQFFAEWAAKALVQHLLQMAQNRQEAVSNAGVAATGAGKSAASIPYIGWILAIGAMASVFAAAKGYSAEGGFDIPSGMNPQTQLHQNEMVLPAPLANRVRNMTEPGGGGSGSGGGMTLNLGGIKAFNSRDVQRQLRAGGALEKALRDLHRRNTGRSR